MQLIGGAAAQASALLLLVLDTIVFLLSANPALASSSAPVSSPPPLKIDLDACDAMKQSTVLPDGETLAYIDMGNPKGRAVMLIRGYTDSAPRSFLHRDAARHPAARDHTAPAARGCRRRIVMKRLRIVAAGEFDDQNLRISSRESCLPEPSLHATVSVARRLLEWQRGAVSTRSPHSSPPSHTGIPP